MILSILKVVFKILPAVLESVRRWDAEKNAKLVVEESERAVEREIAQRGYDAAMADAVRGGVNAARQNAANAALEAKIRELEGFR